MGAAMKSGLLLACIAFSNLAFAEEGLRLGIVVIESSAEAARSCGVDTPSIRSLAALTLRNNHVAVSSEKNSSFLYVAFNVLDISTPGVNGCVFTLGVSVRSFTPGGRIAGFKQSSLMRVIHCEEEYLGIAPRAQAASIILDQVERQIKLCLGSFEYRGN